MLASASPRRHELLSGLGAAFTVVPADLDESLLPGEEPEVYVVRLARAKALAVAGPPVGAVTIAADTTVDLDGHVIGKPGSPDEARSLLRRLSGRTHRVHTGVAVALTRDDAPPLVRAGLATTAVTFGELPETWLDRYVATPEPYDKAGGYGMQGSAGLFVERIDGSPSNVIGLPLPLLRELLDDLVGDHDLLTPRR